MNMNKKQLISLVSATALISVIFGGFFVYVVYGQTASTFWITDGLYPSGCSYSIWRDGNYYFAKDGYGQIQYSGDNFTTVITSCLGNDRTIYMKQATYVLTNRFPSVELKELENIKLLAELGTIWLKDDSIGYVGQLLEIDNCSNVVVQNIIFDQDVNNPDHVVQTSLGLQWLVRVVGGSNHTYFYNCQFLNGAQNGFVTGLCRDVILRDCITDYANEHCVYLHDSEDILFENCDFLNYGKDLRGYFKVDWSYRVTVRDCRLEPNEDGLGVNSSSYVAVIGSKANDTLFENCQFVDGRQFAIEGDYCTIKGGTFERRSATHNYDTVNTWNTANFTTIEDVNFLDWTYRIINAENGADTTIENCYFSGGVTSFIFNFGYRTSAIGNKFNPDITHGVYGFYDATGSGIVDQNHIPNSTLTFLFPSGAINGTNFFY